MKLMTMHQSKGLEFPVVAIAGLGHMPVSPARLCSAEYLTMTRYPL
ncbi:MAG TPA: 3'-5' exonuclease [Burkholderiales bacterium]